MTHEQPTPLEPAPPEPRPLSPAVTIVAAIVLIAFVLLLNIPGELTLRFDDSVFSREFCLPVEHGWPLGYLRRYPTVTPVQVHGGWAYDEVPVWDLWSACDEFRLAALLIDAAIAVGMVAGGLWLFRAWRLRRDHLCQLHLLDLFVLTTAVAGACGWAVWNARELEEEKAALAEVEAGGDSLGVYWERGGPTWLRQLLPLETGSIFDRVICTGGEGASLAKLAQLRHTRSVCVTRATAAELRELRAFPNLEMLNLGFVFDKDRSWVDHCRVPPLERVWAVSIACESGFAVEGLEDLPALRVLDLSDSPITYKHIPRLARLTRLQRLILREGAISSEGLDHLRQLLPNCKVILLPPPLPRFT